MNKAIEQLMHQRIVDGLQLQNLKRPQQEKVVSAVVDAISTRVTAMTWNILDENGKKDLEKSTKLGEKKFLGFVSSKVKYFPQLVENVTKQTLEDFKEKRAKAHRS